VPDHFHHCELHSIRLIRVASARLKRPAMSWSLGNDSRTMHRRTRQDAIERLRTVGNL
jgi:hypothetical protein